jgi:hypothetical protein
MWSFQRGRCEATNIWADPSSIGGFERSRGPLWVHNDMIEDPKTDRSIGGPLGLRL